MERSAAALSLGVANCNGQMSEGQGKKRDRERDDDNNKTCCCVSTACCPTGTASFVARVCTASRFFMRSSITCRSRSIAPWRDTSANSGPRSCASRSACYLVLSVVEWNGNLVDENCAAECKCDWRSGCVNEITGNTCNKKKRKRRKRKGT